MGIIITTTQAQRDRLGACVSRARQFLGMTQEQLAKAAGLRPGQVKRVEHGASAPPPVLRALLAALDAAGAADVDVLRAAVAALPVPAYRPAEYPCPWSLDWPSLRLRVLVAGGLRFPGGQAMEGSTIRVKTSRQRAAQWINAVDQGWVEPVADEDRDAVILMRRKLEDPGVALVIEGRPGRSNAEAGKWHRLSALGVISPDMMD